MELENVKYDAFISYRHCELDSFVCKNLHKKLEAYKLPKSLAKKLKTKTKIERVFRDEDELPLSENLSDPITHALANSEFLIVICTPRLKESRWCLREIETFLQTHDRKHLLVVLAEGEPDESFPYEITHEKITTVDLNGNEVVIERNIEPLAADCRGENNKQRLKNMDEAVVKLCAAIFGVNYDDLKQRHRERKLRKRRIIFSTVFAIVAAFALTCSLFLIKISKQNAEINERFASAMANNSLELYENSGRRDAIYAARSVLTDEYSSKGYNYDALNALSVALELYVPANTYVQTDMIDYGSYYDEVIFSPDGQKVVACEQRSDVSVFYTGSGDWISSFTYENWGEDYAHIAFDGNDAIALVGDNGTKWVNVETGEEKMLDEQPYANVFSSSDGTLFMVNMEGMKAYNNGQEIWNSDWSKSQITLSESYDFKSFAFSGDEKEAVVAINDIYQTYIVLIDTQNGKIKYAGVFEGKAVSVATDYEYVYLIYEYNDTVSKEEQIIEIDCMTNETKLYDTPALVNTLKVSDYGLLACSEYSAFFLSFDGVVVSRLEKEAGAIIEIIDYDAQKEFFDLKDYASESVTTEIYDGSFLIVDSRLNVYALNDMLPYGANISDYFFGTDNFDEVRCEYVNGVFFVSHYGMFDYIQKYERKTGLNYEVANLDGIDNSFNGVSVDMPSNSDELCSHIEDLEEARISGLGVSQNRKYLAVTYGSTEIRIYSMKGDYYELEKIFYEEGEAGTVLFGYDEAFNTYILSTHQNIYLLDEKLNHFSTISRDFYFGTDINTGEILLKKRDTSAVINVEQNVKVCRVPIYDIEEMLRIADREIEYYFPSERIMEKYQIPVIMRDKAIKVKKSN